MNNEEKILSILEQMAGRLDGMDSRFDKMESRLDGMDSRFDKIESRLSSIDSRLDRIEDDVAEIKEHAEVTRSATNSLVEWADTVGVITQVKFPIQSKANNE